jgi:uncharacterized protein YrrD
MRTWEDVSGITVIAIDSGAKIGRVEDLVFDFQENCLLGILVENIDPTQKGRFVSYSQVRGMGPNAVMIEGEGDLVRPDEDARISEAIGQRVEIKGKEVYTMDGKDLGRITDVEFDEKTGRIEGFEVSGGVLSDAYSGRSFIPAPRTIRIGKDVCLVPAETAEEVEKRPGGFKKAFPRLSEGVKQAGLAAQEMGRQAIDKAQELGQALHQKSGERDGTLREARGKVATKSVYADDGSLIVGEGLVVDEAVLEEVRRNHKERELLEAVRGNAA